MDETKTLQVTSRTAREMGSCPTKGRVFTDWQPSEIEPEPTGPLCSDPTCSCRGREVDHKVWKAFNRRVTKVWRDELTTILADHWGVDPAEVKVRFSVHAGCSCPCSPGWVVESGHGFGRWTWVKGHRS